MLIQEIQTEVQFTNRNEPLCNKTNKRDFTICHYLKYLQFSHTECQKDSRETLGHHSKATQARASDRSQEKVKINFAGFLGTN